MLMYGPSKCLQFIDTSSFMIFNFTGMTEGFRSIQALIPPNELGRFDSYEFDVNYANYIMMNNSIFLVFFQIIEALYIGLQVYIISDEANWSENLIESLLKLIQQRYGYNGYCVREDEDVMFALQRDNEGFNTSYGIANLDQDKARYEYLLHNLNSRDMAYFNPENFIRGL